MSMYRNRRDQKKWRTKWPWRALFPLKLDERFCRECRMPFQNGPQPEPVRGFREGNVGALILPGGGYRSGSPYAIRFGRWKQVSRDYYFSEYIPGDELVEFQKVVDQVVAWIDEQPRTKAARR